MIIFPSIEIAQKFVDEESMTTISWRNQHETGSDVCAEFSVSVDITKAMCLKLSKTFFEVHLGDTKCSRSNYNNLSYSHLQWWAQEFRIKHE